MNFSTMFLNDVKGCFETEMVLNYSTLVDKEWPSEDILECCEIKLLCSENNAHVW